MPFELFVALRYLKEARFQTALILAAVTLGVGVVIFLSALINGLQASLIATTLGSQPHVIMTRLKSPPRYTPGDDGAVVLALVAQPPQKELVINDWQASLATARATPAVEAAAVIASGAAFATHGIANVAVALRGIDAAYDQIVPVSKHLKSGRFNIQADQAVVGVELARDLGLVVGDKLRLTTTRESGATLSRATQASVFTIAGIFDLGSRDVNRRWVLTNLKAAQALLDIPGGATTLEVRVKEVFGAERVARRLAASTGLTADSWLQINKQLVSGLRSQDSSRYVIEFFVVIAVALGIASVLMVVVMQKSREIGIMRAFGTSTGQTLRIFLLEGTMLGGLGAVGGVILGAVLAEAFRHLSRNADGGPTFPVAVTPGLLLGSSLLALGVGLVASVLPARRAALLDPAVAIRYG